MAIEDFIREMPKVDLHLHLEGAFNKERLLVIAEQNEIAEATKDFSNWVGLLEAPDYARLDETINTLMQWLEYPGDLSHITYDLGVNLAKQNIRYAEVHVNPIHFTENGWSFEQYLAALNDGRDRAERGWGVQMRWVLSVGRDQPRHADEIVRWASGAAQKDGIVGVEIAGPDDAQPIGQFERAILAAEKKNVPRAVHAGQIKGVDAVIEALEQLEPTRIVDGWGIADSAEAQQIMLDKQIALAVCIKKAICDQLIESYADYPLRSLYDDGIALIIAADMPTLYQTSLVDEYLAVVQQCELEVEELEIIALNAVQASQLASEEKDTMMAEFTEAYARLRETHLVVEEEQESAE